ncbi:holo-ACP synthase [Paenibacillus sp. TRM 82003]|nr:holo-ACP synthase [Paenibacillus sp. TRM 82003]
MIIGIGTDIIGLERIERLTAGARGDAFVRRVLTEAERELAQGKRVHVHRYVEFVAGRWAAKEAVSKALGCGIGAALGFHDIEVLPDERGKPCCAVSAGAWERLGTPAAKVHVTISHADGWVSAFAVAERVQE